MPPLAEGRGAYGRGAWESPGSVSVTTLKNFPNEKEGGRGDCITSKKAKEGGSLRLTVEFERGIQEYTGSST